LTPGLQERFAGAEATAKSLGIALRRVEAATPAELTAAFTAIEASSSEALLIQNDPMLGIERSRILDFAIVHRLPTVFEGIFSFPLGVLLSYGPDLSENARLRGWLCRQDFEERQACRSPGPATDQIRARG